MEARGDPSEAKRRYPDVASMFKGKDVLITGSSGFLGKVLLEKLLHSCPDIGTVFLLLRAKRGVEPAKRLDDLLNSKLFERVVSKWGGLAALHQRILVVRGDVSQPGMGLSEEDAAMVARRVAVFLHCAANVRFDMSLRQALQSNTVGTLQALKMAERIHNLEAFVHVSTSYCHCYLPEVHERLYPPQADPDNVLKLLDWMSDDMLSLITPQLLGTLPNTYAFSKNLSEGLIAKYEGKFPIGLARPSIVTAMWKEPLPGWVDNINGPTGLLIGAGTGVIRSMLCHGDFEADVIPVDMAANAVLALAWRVANERSPKVDVVNLTNFKDNAITWVEIVELGRKYVYKYPLSNTVFFPDGSIKTSWLLHTLCVIFFHFLPAYLIDFLAMVCGRKPFMVRIQRRVQTGLEALQYYTTRDWRFPNTRMAELHSQLPPDDQERFYWSMALVDTEEYMSNSVLGTRHHYLRDSPDTLPKARRRLFFLYILNRTVKVLFYAFLVWMLWVSSKPILVALEFILGGAVSAMASYLHVTAEVTDCAAPDENILVSI